MHTVVDVSEPVKPGLLVCFRIKDVDNLIPVAYEQLPDIYFYCGRLDHLYQDCSTYELARAE